jgi:hypothetical protein
MFLIAWGIYLYLYVHLASNKAEHHSANIMFLALFVAILIIKAPTLARNKLVLDDQAISGRIGRNRFSLLWKDVIAVWDSAWLNVRWLNISASDQRIRIPLKFFDEKLLRDLIRLHLAPGAFEKDAIKRMMGFRVQDTVNERIIEQADKNLRVGAMFVKVVGWVCGLLLLLFAVWAWLDGEGAVSLLFLFFVALCAYLILASGSTEMNKDFIAYVTPIGVYRIAWDEITEVDIDPLGGSLVFRGRDKVLSTLGPSCWSGKDKEQMLRFFSAQIGNRDIVVKETLKVIWPPNKNTKKRSKSR